MARHKDVESPAEFAVTAFLTAEDKQALERLVAANKVGKSTILRQAFQHYIASALVTAA